MKEIDAQFLSILKLKEADRLITVDNFIEAIKYLNEAIEIYNDNYAAYYIRAYVNFETGSFQKVIGDCSLIINKHYNVDLTNVLGMRAASYEKMNLNNLAIDDYSKIIELDPRYENIYIMRGMCYVKNEDYIKAMYDFEEQIKLDKNSGIAYFSRGLLHKILGNYNLARQDFEIARKLGYTGG